MAADGEAVSTPVAPVDHRKAAKRGLGVVITGATKGFGFALAMELLSLGDRLVICGRDEERTQNAVAALKSAYPGGAALPVDQNPIPLNGLTNLLLP